MRRYDNEAVIFKNGPAQDDQSWHENTFAGVEIVNWDRTSNALAKMYDLFDVASPDTKGSTWLPEESTWTTLVEQLNDEEYMQSLGGTIPATESLLKKYKKRSERSAHTLLRGTRLSRSASLLKGGSGGRESVSRTLSTSW